MFTPLLSEYKPTTFYYSLIEMFRDADIWDVVDITLLLCVILRPIPWVPGFGLKHNIA